MLLLSVCMSVPTPPDCKMEWIKLHHNKYLVNMSRYLQRQEFFCVSIFDRVMCPWWLWKGVGALVSESTSLDNYGTGQSLIKRTSNFVMNLHTKDHDVS